jgi:Fibronectin type III domain.
MCSVTSKTMATGKKFSWMLTGLLMFCSRCTVEPLIIPTSQLIIKWETVVPVESLQPSPREEVSCKVSQIIQLIQLLFLHSCSIYVQCFPVPLLPSSNELFSANASSIMLQLSLWPDGGCAIAYFVIEYRILSGNNRNWLLVDNNAPAEQLSVRDLLPATWYQFRLTAHNDAGSTRVHFNFATTTITGGKTSLKL